MKNQFRHALLLVILWGSFLVRADASGFFERDDIVAIRLEIPINSLKKQRGDNVEWLEGKLLYSTTNESEAALNVKIEARGNFRRLRTNCTFPPYWINFRKSEVKGTPFAGLDKVKVVSHCRVEGRRTYEPYMYTEYLAYKTYNLLTDLSFRVRLASIEYYNTDKNRLEGEYGAFFIEHVDSMEKRLSAKQVKDRFILPSRYDQRNLCMAEMFQFFLGNTDFSFFASNDECCHNAKSFAPLDSARGMFPVPYDFDMAGMVSPPYAKPDPNFPITSVKDRMYRGVEVERDVLDETVRHFFNKKKEIYALWENFELLDDRYRARALKFIDEFYSIFDPNKKARRHYTTGLRSFHVLEKSIQEDIDKAQLAEEKMNKKKER